MYARYYTLYLFLAVVLLVSACKKETSTPIEKEIVQLNFLGEFVLPSDADTSGSRVGGLSSIDWDGENTWYLISDDQGRVGKPRFYTATLDYDEQGFQDIKITQKIDLLDTSNAPFGEIVDPEAIRYDNASNTLYWTSEGSRNEKVNPFIQEMNLDGTFIRRTNLPEIFKVDGAGNRGARQNGIFEGITLSVEGTELITMLELPLLQDGEAPSLDSTISPSRIIFIDKESGAFTRQYAYLLDPVEEEGTLLNLSGAVEILAVSEDVFLVMERSFTAGVGHYVKIYKATIGEATDIASFDALEGTVYEPVTKELLLTVNDLELANPVDNIEGMSWGPKLANGNRTLVLVSDDNFGLFGRQVNQFLALEVVVE
ncbi:MAG: esterase-like activity of phytase family protein [Bacteroidota bacterium]